MERYGFHIIISIQASDAQIMKTRTGRRAVDMSISTHGGLPHIIRIIIPNRPTEKAVEIVLP